MERRVKLLRDDEGQFVCIPSEFEFLSEEAIMRRRGNKLIIEPASKQSLLELSETPQPLDKEVSEIETLPSNSRK